MKVLCMFMGLASAGLVACSSSEHATPTANDGGTSSSGWGDAAVGGNPCYIPTVSGQNFIGNPNFVSTDRSPDVVLGFQWQLQAYNEMMNRLQDVSEGTGSAPGDRMYNACKKLAADLGATGNQIAKTSDEPTPADKIKKICDLALDYVRTSTDILPETLNFATKLKCVTRMADIAECVKATKGADPVCIGPEGAKVPIVNGECVDGYLATSDACTVLAAAKMRCVDDLGGEQTVYFSAPSGTGKNNQPALDFMASLPFFFRDAPLEGHSAGN